MRVSILDYGAGNMASVFNAFYNLGASVKIINHSEEIENSDRLIIPGVGSAKNSIDYLKDNKLFHSIQRFLEKGRPMMGICLGFQIFSKNLYEDGKSIGLGFIDADVKKIHEDNNILYTHIGWNSVGTNDEIKKFLKIKESTFFYFCHSYYLEIKNSEKLNYSETFFFKKIPAIILKENFIGTQFHPEKSQGNGSKLLENFLKI